MRGNVCVRPTIFSRLEYSCDVRCGTERLATFTSTISAAADAMAAAALEAAPASLLSPSFSSASASSASIGAARLKPPHSQPVSGGGVVTSEDRRLMAHWQWTLQRLLKFARSASASASASTAAGSASAAGASAGGSGEEDAMFFARALERRVRVSSAVHAVRGGRVLPEGL